MNTFKDIARFCASHELDTPIYDAICFGIMKQRIAIECNMGFVNFMKTITPAPKFEFHDLQPDLKQWIWFIGDGFNRITMIIDGEVLSLNHHIMLPTEETYKRRSDFPRTQSDVIVFQQYVSRLYNTKYFFSANDATQRLRDFLQQEGWTEQPPEQIKRVWTFKHIRLEMFQYKGVVVYLKWSGRRSNETLCTNYDVKQLKERLRRMKTAVQ